MAQKLQMHRTNRFEQSKIVHLLPKLVQKIFIARFSNGCLKTKQDRGCFSVVFIQ